MRRPWATLEEEALRVLARLGTKACAAALERSAESVERKAAAIGVSLRRRSHRVFRGRPRVRPSSTGCMSSPPPRSALDAGGAR